MRECGSAAAAERAHIRCLARAGPASLLGALQKAFQLPARQLVGLGRLVAGARSVRPPQPGVAPRDELYTLHISDEPSANIQGPMRKPLAALVDYLNRLAKTYCC